MINSLPGTVISTDWNGKTYKVNAKDLIWRPAAYAIVIKDGKILLSKQRGSYHLPGGGVDLGEMPEAAAIREVKEETGLEVGGPVLVGSISGFFTWHDKRADKLWHYQSLLHYYTCDFVGGEISIDGFEEGENEFGEFPEWVPLDKLDTIKAGSTIDWLSLVKKVVKT